MNKQAKGHPVFVPDETDRQMVMRMAGMGIPQDMIARAVWNPSTKKPISEATLQKYFYEELQCGRAKVMGVFANGMYSAMEEKQPWALKLFANTQLGWSENTNHNISAKNSDGGEVVIEVKFGKGQQEQDERLAALAAKRNGNGAAVH